MMLLENKVAVLYGGAGAIGTSVASEFVRQGAHVVLCGRSIDRLDETAVTIDPSGARLATAAVDGTDADQVKDHFATVVHDLGSVDISFNMIGLDDVQGKELLELPIGDYLRPIELGARTQFVTATTAARHMVERESGVIMAITATPSRLAVPLVGGFGSACGAIEGMLRTLAAEVGPRGVRVCWLRSSGSPESFGPDVALDAAGQPAGLADGDYLAVLRDHSLLKRFPRLAEIGSAAALMASDMASAITGATANVTCGQIVD